MILSDLVRDTAKEGASAGAFRVLLATRTVDGQELPTGQVQLSEIGLLQVDDSAGEIDVLPLLFMDTPSQCLTVADVLSKLAERSEIGDYALTGVDGFKKLADGGNAQKTVPIIGTYTLAADGEVWLLQHPERQWPDGWFGA